MSITGMCPQRSAVVGTSHHSDEKATTISYQYKITSKMYKPTIFLSVVATTLLNQGTSQNVVELLTGYS